MKRALPKVGQGSNLFCEVILLKKFFKCFGVVFLAVLFLFCSFTVSVFAADVPDQIETTTVDSSMIADVNPIMPVDDETELATMYYVPAGWTCDAGAFSGSDSGLLCCSLFFFDSGFLPAINTFMIGYEYVDGSFVEKADSIVVGLSLGVASSFETITPNTDFFGCFVLNEEAFLNFVDNYGTLLLSGDSVSEEILYENEDLLYDTYSISAGWSVPAGYYDNCDILSSFYLNGILYEDYFFYLGYSFADDGLIETENSIVFFNEFSGDVIQLTSEDSFTLRSFGMNFDLTYFMLHNGTIMPPTLLESIFDIFLSIGEWISGATSALVSMLWDSTNSTLTFLGTLSVAGLAISVSLLLISFLEKFLHFGG